MNARWMPKRYSKLVVVCLASLGWLGLPWTTVQVRSQPQQFCIDETYFYQQNRITTRAQWGRTALQNGSIQPAAAHLVKSLDLANAASESVRAQTLASFIEQNSAVTGWLVHDVDQLIELGATDAVQTVLDAANQLVQGLPDSNSSLKIRAFTTIAADYAAIGDPATALELLAQAQQLEPAVQGAEFKTNALITLAETYGTVGESEIAAQIATRALQQAQTVEYTDPVRRDRTLAAIADIYTDADQLDQALQLAQTIESPYFHENVIGRAAVAAAQTGNLDQATKLAQQLTLGQPTLKTLSTIGIYLVNSGNPNQAQPYFDQTITAIQTHGYPGFSFTQTLIDAGLADIAQTALTAASPGRLQTDGLLDVAQHYIAVNNTVAARDVLQQAMTATHQVDETYAQRELWETILSHAIELNDYDLALATLDTLVAKDLIFDEMSNYATIAVAAARAGDIDLALSISDRIDPSYTASQYRVWRAIAMAHATSGDFAAAFAMAEKTQSPYAASYAHTLAKIAQQQQQFGLTTESASTLDQAIQFANALDSPAEQLQALNLIALEQVKANQSESANPLLDQVLILMQQQATDPLDTFTLQTVAQAWIDIGNYPIALKLLDTVADTQPDNTLWKTLIVDPLIRQGDYATALEMLQARDTSAIQTEEMMQIAELYLQAGQPTQARQLLNRVYNAPDITVTELLRLSELYIHMEQSDQVLPALDRAFKIAQTVPGEESQVIYIRPDLVVDDTQDRGSLYEEIAVAYGRAGAYDQGLAVVQTLQDSATRQQAMARLTCYRNF